MKRFLILLSLLFCNTVCADIINLRFVNEDNTTYENKTCTVGGDVILPSTTPSKRGYNFVGWKIPQYIPIEYLENVSGTYIDTGFSANVDTKVIVDFNAVSANGAYASGCYVMKGSNVFRINNDNGGYGGAISTVTIAFGENVKAVNAGNTRRLVVVSKDGIFLNNQKLMEVTQNQVFKTPNLHILESNACVIRLYSFQIYQNNILVHDYVPALDLSGVTGLYDKVGEVFLYNAGTGEFVAGPIVDYD